LMNLRREAISDCDEFPEQIYIFLEPLHFFYQPFGTILKTVIFGMMDLNFISQQKDMI